MSDVDNDFDALNANEADDYAGEGGDFDRDLALWGAGELPIDYGMTEEHVAFDAAVSISVEMERLRKGLAKTQSQRDDARKRLQNQTARIREAESALEVLAAVLGLATYEHNWPEVINSVKILTTRNRGAR